MSLSYLATMLQKSSWEHNFTERTLERARAYAEDDRLTGLDYDLVGEGDLGTLTALVQGSDNHLYHCDIDIDFDEDDSDLLIHSACTCPVGHQCKHAATMLYVASTSNEMAPAVSPAIPQPPAETDVEATWRRWERWLERVQTSSPDGWQADPDRHFGILLEAGYGDQLRVLPVWMRPSKRAHAKGELVDPKPVHLSDDEGPVPTPEGGWNDTDAAALTLVLNAPIQRDNNRDWYLIRARHAEKALLTLLDTYPAYLARGSQPLQRGPDAPFTPQWQEADDGRQLPGIAIDSDLSSHDWLILKGAGFWYIAADQRLYGRLQGNQRYLENLRNAPELPAAMVDKLRQKLTSGPLAGTLPLPHQRERGTDIRVEPTPILHLHVRTLQHAWRHTDHDVGCAHLGFIYGPVEIEAPASTHTMQRVVDGRLHTVYNDAATEKRHVETLLALGLTPLEAARPFHDAFAPANQPPQALLVRQPHDNLPPASAENWQDLLDTLQGHGFELDFADDFPHQQALDVDDWYGQLEPSGNHWFDVSLGIEVEGRKIDLLPLLRRLVADPRFPRRPADNEAADASWRVRIDAEHFIELPLTRLRELIEPLLEWLESEHEGPPRIHTTQGDLLDTAVHWHGGDALRQRIGELRRADKPTRTPRGFKATLRPYQHDGLAWLNFLARAQLGGILADDMGLGKTVQVLAHIVAEKQARRLPHPALVVAPTSLVGNWASEAARFAPRLKVLVLHGPERQRHYAQPDQLDQHDLIITTYPLLPRDRDYLIQPEFSLLVLDEAQTIKNARSQAAQVVRELNATRRLAMTGTPLENHLGELWAQFDAVEPGILGSERQFKRSYRTPIEKHGDAERQQRLNQRIGSLMLRRRKEDVLPDLPAKTDIVHTLELTGKQRELYETLRLAQHERVQQAVRERGLSQSGIIVLDALLKLRQACCDPRLVKLASARKVKASAKLNALLELIDGLMAEGRRVLVFSQFTTMLELIAEALDKRKLAYETLTGKTPAKQRTAAVARFQNGDTPLFLISLKAGGTGLNLTAADTVIHYDPWWNPAVEAQATDRAHRIGQDKAVFVYRLICQGTVEEKIQAMQAKKADLAKAVLEGGSSQKLRFDEADLNALFGPT